MADLGIAPHIVEACLNHVSGAKAGVAGTYNRAAYAPEKRAALERWAAHIERVPSAASRRRRVASLRMVRSHGSATYAARRRRACRGGLRHAPNASGPTVIKGGLAERWGDKPIAGITSHDIWVVVEETRRSGVPGLERRTNGRTDPLGRVVLATLSSFFGWLQRNRRIERNPCENVHRPDAAPARDRTLTDDEIVAFWHACDDLADPIGQLLKLLLLTGCRRTELAGMLWSEIGADSTWVIPGARTKNRRSHAVPLPPLARHILNTIKPIAGAAGFVFTTSGTKPDCWLVEDQESPRRHHGSGGALATARFKTNFRNRAGRSRHPPGRDRTRGQPPFRAARRHRRRLQQK